MTLLRFTAILLLGVSFFSCETDFQLEGDWKDVPVIYAFMSVQDTAHYVRVEKAFLEPGGDAIAIAQIPDSIYYGANQAVVKLDVEGTEFILERVNGDAEGYPKDGGTFADTPNILYKIPAAIANIQQGDLVKIIVERGNDTDPAIAETNMLSEMQIANTPSALNYSDYSRNSRVEWRTNGDYATIFDVQLIIKYRETDPDNPSDLINKELHWSIAETYEKDQNLSLQNISFKNESFYQFVGANLEPIENGIRKITSVSFQVTGVGPEIKDYLTIANANLGITSSQSIPVYTNVENGRGLVTSRYQILHTGLQLSPDSRDSLYNGIYTGDLNFVP